MALRSLSRVELLIQSEDDVVLIRRKVRQLAEERRFDPFATAAVTTATSELVRNVFVHAGKGVAIVEELQRDDAIGIRVELKDDGPGIANLERVMQGGKSSVGSLGLGLSGSRRLVDEFDIHTMVGQGTDVRITKWKRLP